MGTRKSKNTELAAAAGNLAEAARHIRQAVSDKVEAIGASASIELGKVRQVALTKGGQAERRLEALLRRVEGRLTQAINEASRSLHRVVRDAEKTLQATTKAAQAGLTDLHLAGQGKAATRKATLTKAPTKKAALAKAPAKRVVVKKAPARKPAVKRVPARKPAA